MSRYLTAGLAAIAGFVMTAGLASASPRDPDASPTPTATSTAKPVRAAPLYCIEDTLTGTRIPRRVCKTATEWRAEGVDPLNP